MIVPHNYGRYYDKIVTDVAGMQKFWQTLATPYKDNQYVIFDTNNECKFQDSNSNLVSHVYSCIQSMIWTNPWSSS